MNEQDKPFVYYKGYGQMRVVPRNGWGWGVFIGYMTLSLAPLIAIPFVMQNWLVFLVAYLGALAVATIGFVRYAIANAEVVDLRFDAADVRAFRQWRDEQRRGRR